LAVLVGAREQIAGRVAADAEVLACSAWLAIVPVAVAILRSTGTSFASRDQSASSPAKSVEITLPSSTAATMNESCPAFKPDVASR